MILKGLGRLLEQSISFTHGLWWIMALNDARDRVVTNIVVNRDAQQCPVSISWWLV